MLPRSLFAFILFVSFFIVSVSSANELHTLLKQRLKLTSPNQPLQQSLSGKTCKQGITYTKVSDYTENCVCNPGEQCLFNATNGLAQGCSCQYGPCTNGVCPEQSCVPATLSVNPLICDPTTLSGAFCPDGMALTSFYGCSGTCCSAQYHETTSTNCGNSAIATEIQGFSDSFCIVKKCLTGLKLSCSDILGPNQLGISINCPKDSEGRATFIQSYLPANQIVSSLTDSEIIPSIFTCCAIIE